MEGCAKGCRLPVTKARNSRRRADGRWEHLECPSVQPHERRDPPVIQRQYEEDMNEWAERYERLNGEPVTSIRVPGRFKVEPVGPCPCECNSGGFCGGCGHAGCGGRR